MIAPQKLTNDETAEIVLDTLFVVAYVVMNGDLPTRVVEIEG
jgi:hypothetical protein